MNPEQIEQLLRLVRDYGDCLSVSMESDRYLSGREMWQKRAEVVFEKIEAALKGESTDGLRELEETVLAVRSWDDEQRAEYWEATARLLCEISESHQAKAAALDAILAAWGMTWEQYQGKGEACPDG